MSVTIIDLAQATGKSYQTVSRALQNNPRISAKTRALIQATAQKMGYTPNRAASRLRAGKTKIIGIAIPSPLGHSYAELADALHTEILSRNYAAIFAFWKTLSERDQALTNLLAWNPEGIITIEPRFIPDSCKVPVVSYMNYDPRFDSVVYDYPAEIAQLFAVLKELKFKSVSWLGHDIRGQLIAEAAREHNLAFLAVENSPAAEYDFFQTGTILAQELLKKTAGQPLPEVIVAQNDMVAIGIIFYLNTQGIHCPEDISVIGSGNVQVADYFLPQLATFSLGSRAEIARKLLDALFERLAKSELPPRKIVLPTSLIRRGSLGQNRG